MSDSKEHSHDTHAAVTTDAASHDAHNMHFGLYWGIGGVLIALTGVTVWLSYFDFGSRERNIVIAMLVATFKVSLVGAIFMHLKGEKPTIWRFLYFTAFFVTGLFLLTALHWVDPIFGTQHNLH
ncbi:MAG: hypothetical protein JWL59_1057 [Chthoniobacteraceae bacterium]|nr:hypothetical protein [Chthoniobacteraceae bacterium]